MSKYTDLYNQKKKTAAGAIEMIRNRDWIFTAQAAAEPVGILQELQHLKDTGVRDIILNTCLPMDYPALHDPEMKKIMSHHGWFFSAALRKERPNKLVSAVPQCSTTVLKKTLDRVRFEGRRPVVMATVSPMDDCGYMTLSISAIYERDLINAGAYVILEVNKNYPRTFGDTLVHVSEADVLVESDRPIPTAVVVPYTDVDEKIGKNVASLVEDGSTIQLGIGNIPNAVANELKTKKHLGIHTEMFTETMVDLIECGAVDNSQKGFYNGIQYALLRWDPKDYMISLMIIRAYCLSQVRFRTIHIRSERTINLYQSIRHWRWILWGRRLPRPLDIISGPEQADSLRRFRAHRCHREESQFWQCIPHIMQRTRTVIKY